MKLTPIVGPAQAALVAPDPYIQIVSLVEAPGGIADGIGQIQMTGPGPINIIWLAAGEPPGVPQLIASGTLWVPVALVSGLGSTLNILLDSAFAGAHAANVEVSHEVSYVPSKVGMIEALSTAIGEADADIGGLIETRLTAVVPTGTALNPSYVWNGTTTVASLDTSEVAVGDWIRLDSDGQYFEIESIVPDTSVTILNPYARPIPTGSTASSKAVTTFPVETTLDWDDAGMFGIDGVRYHYASKTDTSFQGVYHLSGGEVIPGPIRLLRVQSTVIDLNRSRTAMELVRRAMLVDYAEGEDLNTLARNLGVLRLPFLSGDAQFRAILKALAYNPKGTMFGLELALTGLVGVGNFEIYEDLIRYPCTVFIRLLGSATTDTKSQGKAFLSGVELAPLATESDPITLANPIKERGAVHGVFWAPTDHVSSFRSIRPNEEKFNEYPGAPLTSIWTNQGDANFSKCIDLDPEGCEFVSFGVFTEARCRRHLYVTSKATMRLEGVLHKLPGATEGTRTFALTITDGTRGMNAVVWANATNSFRVGMIGGSVTGPFGAPAVQVDVDNADHHNIALEKYKDEEWRLYVDQTLISTLPYSAGVATAWNRVLFGMSGVTPASLVTTRVKQVSYWSQDNTDFASARGNNATLANPNYFDTGSYTFQADDVGKMILIEKSTGVNPAGGNNNGRWKVTAIGGTTCNVEGLPHTGANTTGASATRIVVPTTGAQFRFPDDLGRTITITGSTLGNNGTWVISQLLDPDTLVDLDSWATKIPTTTNVCEVTGASFVPETGLGWQLHPDFAAEFGLEWSLPNAIDVVGQTITLRQPPAAIDVPQVHLLAVTYSEVLSAQILANAGVGSEIIQEVPEVWYSYYPFYLADPLGFIRTYLREITAAGIIPDFQVL